MAYSITLAGQDITQYVDQLSIDINDTLGQGGGAGSGPSTQGRASTFKFNTSLGPASLALGAGSFASAIGKSMLFDGTSGYISLPTALDAGGWSQVSVEIWANLSTASLGSFSNLIAGGSGNNGYSLYWNGTSSLNFQVGNGTTNHVAQYVVPASSNVGTWWHIVGTYDGSVARLYVNGVLRGTSATIGGAVGAGGQVPAVGAGVGHNLFFPGYLSGLAIYNTALSQAQVSNHWGSGAGSYSFAGYQSVIMADSPQAYYPMNDRGGTIADKTANGYTGILHGGITPYQPGRSFIPVLVRQGEVIITDATNTIIFAGYATKLTDTSTAALGNNKQPFTEVAGIDYSTSLQRTQVSEIFTGATDLDIIKTVMQKYVGWVKLDYLPTKPAYFFEVKRFSHRPVEQVIQEVAGVTGYIVYVDYLKYLHYIPPTVASSAPFSLSSDPDFISTFPHWVEEYLIEDTSAINRVTFHGGTRTSQDFWQDISVLANGNNLTFPLAYYPSHMSDGRYHLKTNGVDQFLKTTTSGGENAQFISQGGTATVLIDPGSRTIVYDTGYAPASGTQLLAGYRYSYPLSLLLTDENSHKFFGGSYLDGYIDDNTVFDLMTGIQRCRVVLAQQSYGLVTLRAVAYKAGIQAGMLLQVKNAARGINGTYLVQGVQIAPQGGGNFEYRITLGAWNWNLIDYLIKLPSLATFQDITDDSTETVIIEQILSNVQVHDAWTTRTSTPPYYARTAAVGDGHDAYPGFSTITS